MFNFLFSSSNQLIKKDWSESKQRRYEKYVRANKSIQFRIIHFATQRMACFKKTIWFCFIFLVLYAVFSQVEATQCKSDGDCSTGQCCDSGNNCDVVCYEGSKTPSTALLYVFWPYNQCIMFSMLRLLLL